jgi:hypothetical protein
MIESLLFAADGIMMLPLMSGAVLGAFVRTQFADKFYTLLNLIYSGDSFVVNPDGSI